VTLTKFEHILARDCQPFPKRQETYIRYCCGDAMILLECKLREVDDGVDMAIIGSGSDRAEFLSPSLYAERERERDRSGFVYRVGGDH
jgi:hypothetical protein